MEFLMNLLGPKKPSYQQQVDALNLEANLKELEIKAEGVRQLHHARQEYLQSMMKVEYHTANARAAQQTIARLEAANGTAK